MRVQGLLRVYKLTQAEFAKIVGVNYNTLRSWIYQSRFPDIISGCEMAQILGVKVEYLVQGRCKPGSRKKIKPVKDQSSVIEKKNILVFKNRDENK